MDKFWLPVFGSCGRVVLFPRRLRKVSSLHHLLFRSVVTRLVRVGRAGGSKTMNQGATRQVCGRADNHNKIMNKVKLDLRNKSDSDLAVFAQQHVTAMTGNANFATPLPAAVVFAGILTNFNSALADATAAQQAAKQKTAAKDAARTGLETALIQRGNYVDLIAVGDEAKILSAGLDVRAGKTPVAIPGQVMNLSLTFGDNEGELDAQWDAPNGAKSFDIEISPDPITPTSWTAKPSVTKSKTVLMGLPSGSRIWVRGAGGWAPAASARGATQR